MIDDNIIEGYIGEARDLWLKRRETETAEHFFPEGFENKIRCAGGRKHRPAAKVIASAVIAAALVMTGVAGQLPVFEFAQNGLLDIGVSIYDESTDFSVSTDYVDNGEVKRPYFNWLPEGIVEINRKEHEHSAHVQFENANGTHLSVYIGFIPNEDTYVLSVDTEDVDPKTVDINGNTALLVEKENRVLLEYFVNNYSISINGEASADDVIKIAENIELK